MTSPRTASIRTERLRLRPWRDADREPFSRMNRDPRVMRYFPRLYDPEESDDFVRGNDHLVRTRGWGYWAVEIADGEPFIGFVGLGEPPDWHPCAGSIEIGWRLRPAFQGAGYATEASRAALRVAFRTLDAHEVVAFTAAANHPSIGVMRKLGMRDDGIGFEHPRIDPDSPLCTHVVHRLSRARWETLDAARSGE